MRSFYYLSLPVSTDIPRLEWLLREYRLIVNESIRIAESQGIRSRARLSAAAYSELSMRHDVLRQYIPSALGVALGALKSHRRRLKDKRPSVPYMKRLMLRIVNQGYRLDRMTGRIRVSVRPREHVHLDLPVSAWHRRFLSDPSWSLGSLTIVPGKVIIVMRKEAPTTYTPSAALALDTNEDSLDGVVAAEDRAHLLTAHLGGIRQVQETHFRRRRRLTRKKSNDRRLTRVLNGREGRRERNRVLQRLHRVTKAIAQAACQRQAAIVLEDLTLHGAGGHSRKLNRRLASWPRREIHRQIEYKAALLGVPVIKVNPKYTSKTCPACGARRRERAGKVFECPCGWRLDRQLNAGLNILKSALASDEALARAVRFQPGALRKDVVIPLYDLLAPPAGAREEPSGVESGSGEVETIDFIDLAENP